MMKEQNIPQDSLIAGYLPADYCDSFSRNVVSEKAITSDEFFDMAFNHSPGWVNGLMKKGMLHAYTYQSDKKVTFWFGKEGDAIFPLQTLHDNRAGYENIELLEDSVLYELSVDKLHNLYLEDIHIANWGRKFAERECIKSEKLFISRQFKTSLERYQELISEYPDILQRVPLGIIASYLGISQVNLSRIRAKIR